MIDATQITNYNLSYDELQERILFWILAAGKNGTRAANIINDWVFNVKKTEYIFDTLKHYSLGGLVELCYRSSTGCQSGKARSIYEIVHSNIDLTRCTPEELEKIYGIGMKTARCFIIHSRENAPYAGLDTHILKFLSKLELDITVPKSTPSCKIYLQLEQIVLKLAKEFNMSPADFDLMIWNTYKEGNGMKAVYAGSFNPFTIGHKYILDKAIQLFGADNVDILLVQNPNKPEMSFYLKRHIQTFHRRVEMYTGLLTDYCKDNNIGVIIKGLRSVTDFESELDQAHWNDMLSDDKVTTIFIPSSPNLQKISSSAVRLIDKHGKATEFFVNSYSEARWKLQQPKYTIYFGKIAVGKSTLLKRIKHVVDFDTFVWTWFTQEDIAMHKRQFKEMIVSGNVTGYENKMAEMAEKMDWYGLFKMAADISPYFEMSALGAWFKYLPVDLIAAGELWNVTCNEYFRITRAANRGLSETDIKNFDRFYKLPLFWDHEVDVS